MSKVKLIPPNIRKCQAMVVRGGCYPDAEHFMMLGGHGQLVQCGKKPSVIAYENRPGDDEQKGSMSLCIDCLKKFKKRFPLGFATIKPILKKTGEGK